MITIGNTKNIFSHVQTARYNVAAWQDSAGTLFTLGRELIEPTPLDDPDFGRLVLTEFDSNRSIMREQVVWEPKGDSLWLEDPRALPLPDGSVLIGLTAVLREKRGYKPYPAVTKLNRMVWREEVLPAVTIVERFGSGKNITPINENNFLFRPDKEEYFHKLLLFSFVDLVPRKIQDIEFPRNLDWASWRVGTALPPIWLDENSALMIFHGITIKDSLYIYSLGRAKLEKKNGVFQLTAAPEPILTPDNFLDAEGKPLVRELHPKIRRVVYVCGGVMKGSKQDRLSLYVNIGDTSTFEVDFPLKKLLKDLF